MKLAAKLACLSLLTVLAACDDSTNGYYDSRGNFHADSSVEKVHRTDNYYVDHSAVRGDSAKVAGYDHNLDPDRADTNAVIVYKRAGYYDSNGYFINANAGPSIPRTSFPPRGMCRVWFLDRVVAEQPPVESCDGIQTRVPAGAYVVYGG